MLFLISTISQSHAATVTWQVGDSHLWGINSESFASEENLLNNLKSVVELNFAEDLQYNITGVDKAAKRYEAIPFDSNTVYAERGFSYAWDDFEEEYLGTTSFLEAGYTFDIDTNESILTSFSLNFEDIDLWFLLEPEWANINSAFAELLDTETVLDSVANYYAPANITDITFGDFLGKASSYKIMGKKSIENALKQFTTKSKWTFEFDLSGVMKFPVFNSTAGRNNYYSFSKYIANLELKYTSDGVLETFRVSLETKRTEENVVYETITSNVIALGGIKSATGNNSLIAIIAGFLFTTTVTTVILSKRKR